MERAGAGFPLLDQQFWDKNVNGRTVDETECRPWHALHISTIRRNGGLVNLRSK